MPLYSYRCEDCERVQLKQMTMQEIHPEYVDCPCGKGMARRSLRDDLGSAGERGNPWRDGLCSNSVGVARHQIPEAMAADAAVGVPIQYNERGQAVFNSRAQRRNWCKAHGYVDKEGGFGDYTGR